MGKDEGAGRSSSCLLPKLFPMTGRRACNRLPQQLNRLTSNVSKLVVKSHRFWLESICMASS